jgi:hypothetical protein
LWSWWSEGPDIHSAFVISERGIIWKMEDSPRQLRRSTPDPLRYTDGSTQRTAAATCYGNLHSDRPSVRESWRARHGRSSGDQTAELKNSKAAKCRALRHKSESPSSLYARRHSRDSGIATTRPLIGDSTMTALLKYLAVLGFAGALSLATTTSFAQNVSGSACGEASNGNYYC